MIDNFKVQNLAEKLFLQSMKRTRWISMKDLRGVFFGFGIRKTVPRMEGALSIELVFSFFFFDFLETPGHVFHFHSLIPPIL